MTARSHARPDLLKRVLAEARGASSDRHLLQRFLEQGDERAFGEIVDRHGPMLLGLCRRQLAASDLAEDVLQATFLVLARQARSIRGRDNLAGWLYGVARRLIGRARRSDMARRQRERLAAGVRSVAADPAWDELLRVLDDELQRLPARYREPLLLCYLEGLTQDEAVVRLGWSLSTLRRRLERGRTLLRARMIGRGATLGAGLLASVVAPSAVRAALSSELRQGVLQVAASAWQPAAIAPAVWLLARGELRMALLLKALLGSALALTVAAVLVVAGLTGGDDAPVFSPCPAVRPPAAPGHDLAGEPLPNGAVARLGTEQMRHGPYGYALQFAADGKQLVSLGGGRIRRWDLATGHAAINLGKGWPVGYTISRELVSAYGKRGIICALVDVPNGVDFACTEYDLQTGKALRAFSLDLGGVTSRAAMPTHLSPDGKFLAGQASEVRVWHTSNGTQAHHFKPKEGSFSSMAFTPDSKSLIVGDDVHTLHVFDLASGTEQRSFGVANVQGIAHLAVAPDGKRLATVGGGDSFVRLWDLASDTEERTLDFPEAGRAQALLFTPDSHTLLVGIAEEKAPARRAIRSFDAASGQARRAWTTDASIGFNLAVTADGQTLATMNEAGVIRLWDLAGGEELRPLPGSPCALQTIHFQPDGKSVRTVGADLAVRTWDAATGRPLGAPRAVALGASAEFLADGRLLVHGRDKSDDLRVVDPVNGTAILQATGREAVVSADGKQLATSAGDGMIRIYDLPAGKLTRSWTPPREKDEPPVKVRGFSADGRSLILQGEVVSTWALPAGTQRTSWSLQRSKVLDASEEPKPRFKLPGFKQPGSLRSPLRQLRAVAVSPDGSKIAFGLDGARAPGLGGGQFLRFGRLMVLETATGKLLQQSDLDDEQIYFHCFAFSADGKRLAAGGIGTVQVWQVGTEKAMWRFEGHRGRVEALAFSPDGRRLASASNDSTALVWDLGP